MDLIRRVCLIALALGLVALAAPAARGATTTTACTTEQGYEVCGRAFPDPMAGLPADPHAEGLVAASAFIQFGLPGELPSEIWDGLRMLEKRYDRFLEVWALEDLLDEPDARSAGLWVGNQRQRLPLILARVTDESVPATNKRRFVFGLSLHGIERAGVEGGTRALEDLVTYGYCESLGGRAAAQADPICSQQAQVQKGAFTEGEGGFPARLLFWDEDSLTIGDTLKQAELYFTYNNPDGWHRGDLPSFGGIGHYQRYNGNGIDPNRDWPVEGYTYAPYTPASEPETKYFAEALAAQGGNWASGIDLHGMTTAPVLTYTMLPAGQHDFRRNGRIRAIAERTQRDGAHRLTWSPLIDDGSGENPLVTVPGYGDVVAMGPQQWGTIWDTINYTITGAFGDWINNPTTGLGALGMDNEMALSHVTNCGVGSCFVPDVEQLHVAGNKGLIYSDIDTTLRTENRRYRFPFEGTGAYLVHRKVRRNDGAVRASRVSSLPAQDALDLTLPCAASGGAFVPVQGCVVEFDILGPSDGVFNGGVRADIGFAATHSTNDNAGSFVLEVLAEGHDGEGEWVEVATNDTSGQAYFPNGQTIAHNDPVPGRYRIRGSGVTPGPYSVHVAFSRSDAYADPGQAPYRATNLDFFDELNRYLPRAHHFEGLRLSQILREPSALDAYEVLVLPDEALPGWNHDRPKRSRLSRAQHDAYYDALRAWVERGGVLVLTDSALQGLPSLTGRKKLAPTEHLEFAGWVGFNDGEEPTYDDPLARDVNVPGAAEGSNNRHQTYEPVPLGFRIENGFLPAQRYTSPVWTLERTVFEKQGGRVAGMVDGRVVLGEIPLERGAIRVLGALLPTPTDEFDHRFGLSSYALTWTGWQLFDNLVNAAPPLGPKTPKVLGETKRLPATGLTPGAIIVVVALAGGAVIVRRFRHASWI